MATQRWIVARIIGTAAGDARDMFEKWDNARTVRLPDNRSSAHWPTHIHHEADRFVTALRAHAHSPPVIAYAEWIDNWSMGDLISQLSPRSSVTEIWTEEHQLALLSLDETEQANHITRKITSNDADESRLFAKRIGEAIDACKELATGGVVIIVRQILGPSMTDEEILASAEHPRDWLKPENHSES